MAYLVLAWLFEPAPVAERSAPPPPAIVETTTSPPVTATQSIPIEPTASTASEEPTVAVIPPAPPTRLYQPDTGLNMAVLELPVDRRDPVNPPTKMEAYWNPEPLPTLDADVDYAPGSVTADLSVIASHTGTSRADIGFNSLYDWQAGKFALTAGSEVWIQTEASAEQWLVYRLVDQIVVPKGELADNAKVWGEAPKPNHLILIGCRQIAKGTPSTDNFVLDFVFDRVDSL